MEQTGREEIFGCSGPESGVRGQEGQKNKLVWYQVWQRG